MRTRAKKICAALCGALAVTLVAAVATVFHPRFQRHVFLREVAPYCDYLAADHVQVTPWSVTLRGLTVRHRGALVDLASVELRFSPLGLPWNAIDIGRLAIRGAVIDVRRLEPGPDPSQPFPGVLALLTSGYRVTVDELALEGRVELADDTLVGFELNGGAIAPAARGTVHAAVHIERGGAPEQLDLAGDVALVQSADGRMDAIESALSAALQFGTRARKDRFGIALSIKAADPPVAPVADGAQAPRPPSPEDVDAVLTVKGEGGGTPAQVRVSGQYRGTSGEFDGRYTLATDARLIESYVSDPALPEIEQRAAGRVHLSLTASEVALTLGGDVTISALEGTLGNNAALPPFLRLHNDLSVAVAAGELRVMSIDTRLSDPQGRELVRLDLVDPVVVPFAEPRAVLAGARRLLGIQVDGVPLAWFSGLASGTTIAGGRLSAAFEVRASDGALLFAPLAPLQVAGLELRRGEQRVDAIDVRLDPTVTLGREALRLAAPAIEVTQGGRPIASAGVALEVPLGPEATGADLETSGQFRVNDIATLPFVAGLLATHPLPPDVVLGIKTRLRVRPGKVKIQDLAVSLTQAGHPDVVVMAARKTFVVRFAESGPTFKEPQGEIASLRFNGVDFGWFNSLLPELAVEGSLASAEFVVLAPEAGTFVLRPAAPLVISGLGVARAGRSLVTGLSVGLMPEVRYGPREIRVDYADFLVANRHGKLLSGEGSVGISDYATDAPVLHARGHLDANLRRLARQPAIAGALDEALPKTGLGADFHYDLTRTANDIRATVIEGNIRVGGEPRVRVENLGELVFRPRIGKQESLARHLVGRVALDIHGLSSAVLAELGDFDSVAFEEARGAATLDSDGERLAVRVTEPFMLRDIRVGTADSALLRPFTIEAIGEVHVRDHRINGGFGKISVAFAGDTAQALSGTLALTLEPGRRVPLAALTASVTGDLSALLNQPLLLPGHGLSAGTFTTVFAVDPSGAIVGTVNLGGLRSAKRLAIRAIESSAQGRIETSGQGFEIAMPVTGEGKSGVTTAMIKARYAPETGKKTRIELRMESERVFLNDVLASIGNIRGGAPAPARGAGAKKTGKRVARQLDQTPAARAFWDLLPYDARFKFKIGELSYTDYVVFGDVAGSVRITDDRLSLTRLRAHFHDSPMQFDGSMTFTPGLAEPYDLRLGGSVKDFNLDLFFRELIPENKPRVEGLFGVAVDAFGQSPNIDQYRNRLLFDIKMQSRDGVYRPLPPESSLLIGASGFLGIVGEGLSYVPTGGFGAGVVSRLVNYIAEIDYDTIDIHVLRDESRDIRIAQFLVLSPTVSLEAEGGVDYKEGKDILDSPLSLTAHLNMSGRGAAILYSMDLLKNAQDRLGYWKGPEFAVTGTPAEPQSNFAEIISAAGEGVVRGALTRPISGLIGNLRFRWFGKGPEGAPADDGVADPVPESSPPN